MSGRPKPAALRFLQGNPGHRPIPHEPEPPGEVVKPPGLTGRAAAIWDWMAPIAIGMGTLKSADVHQFAIWCKLAAVSEGDIQKMKVGQMTAFRQLSESFGMNAVGRTRLGTRSKPAAEANPFQKLA